MSEGSGDKTHDASPGRIKKARARGDVAVSPEVAVFASYAGLLVGFMLAGGAVLALAETLCGAFLSPESFADAALKRAPTGMSTAGARAVALLIAPAGILVLLGIAVQGGFVFAPTKLKPEMKKLNPVENAKKKYGPTGLGEFARGAVKVTAAAGCGAAYLWARREDYLAMIGSPVGGLPEALRGELAAVVAMGCVVAGVVALVDLPFRRMRHLSRLKMSRKEVQDEGKEQEGDPTQKQARKKRASEVANNRMLQDTAGATVVLTNPTHYAVALKWDRGADSVPRCVAKGTDHFALAIRERARLAGVPIREDRTTARALHASVEVGGLIEPEHYAAVAAAIRYAEAVSKTVSRS